MAGRALRNYSALLRRIRVELHGLHYLYVQEIFSSFQCFLVTFNLKSLPLPLTKSIHPCPQEKSCTLTVYFSLLVNARRIQFLLLSESWRHRLKNFLSIPWRFCLTKSDEEFTSSLRLTGCRILRDTHCKAFNKLLCFLKKKIKTKQHKMLAANLSL